MAFNINIGDAWKEGTPYINIGEVAAGAFEDSSVGHTEVHTPTITRATIDEVTYKYGDGSGLFIDIYVNYVAYPNSSDWNLGTVFTIGVWTYSSNFIHYICYRNTANWWFIRLQPTQVVFCGDSGSTVIRSDFAAVSNAWHYIEIGRNGGSQYVSIDGIMQSVGGVCYDAVNYFDDLLLVGRLRGGNTSSGNIDVFKIDKGICRHTSDFTPPANEDVDNDKYTVLLLKMNATKIGGWRPGEKVYQAQDGNSTWESVKDNTWEDLAAENWDYEKQSWKEVI